MADEYPNISATLRYLANHPKYATEKPYRLVEVPPTSEVPSTNMEFVTYSDVQIKDIRKQQNNTSIETHGFRLYEIPSEISMDSDYKEIELYCRSMADFVKAELGALEVFVFEFRVRNSSSNGFGFQRLLVLQELRAILNLSSDRTRNLLAHCQRQ
jgi:hypothetical protein